MKNNINFDLSFVAYNFIILLTLNIISIFFSYKIEVNWIIFFSIIIISFFSIKKKILK